MVSASAQEGRQQWTLRQCIDYAVEHNIDIRQQELAVESADLDLNTSRNSRLPSLNAGLGQGLSFGRTISDQDNRYVENTQAMSTSGSISTSVPVFQGFEINHQIGLGKLNLMAATEGLERAKQDLELAVAGYYMEVLFSKEIAAVFAEQLALSEKQLALTRDLVDTGKAPKSQLFEMEAQLATSEVESINAQNRLKMALLDLSQALDLEWSDLFDIAPYNSDAVGSATILSGDLPDTIYETALATKPVIREAEYRLEGSERQIKIAQSARWPQISLGAQAGDNYYYTFGQENQMSLADQLRLKHSESVGLNVNIPIFGGFRTRNSVRQARLNRTNYSLQLEGTKRVLYKEIQQAYQGAVAAQAKYRASEKAVAAAMEAYRAMELRYEYGKATVYEFAESQAKLISSRSDELQAKYDFLFRTKVLDFYSGMPIEIL